MRITFISKIAGTEPWQPSSVLEQKVLEGKLDDLITPLIADEESKKLLELNNEKFD